MLTSVNPPALPVGSSATLVTLTGTNFISGSIVDFNGTPISTTFVSSTDLTALIPAADLATAGTDSITVFNRGPGGGTSTAQPFTVNNPAPNLTGVSPASATVGDSNTTVTLTGSSFVNGSTAHFNSAALTTTFVSATQLAAVIPASDLTTVGTDSITVITPGPGGGASGARTFTVNYPAPTLSSISPPSATVGGLDTAITLTGTNFINSSTAEFNGTPISTTFVSATQLTAVIPMADLAAAGTDLVTVVNPGPGGGPSAAATFTVNNPAPTLTGIDPMSGTVGDSDTTITLIGTNFISSSTVHFTGVVLAAPSGTATQLMGVALATTFVSATQLTAVIPAADLTAAGADSINVVNPGPGGGPSGVQTFTVNNPAPVLTSISPTSATVGDPDTTIRLTGGNFIAGFSFVNRDTGQRTFVSGSTAEFNGTAISTHFVNSTELTAVIPADDLATAGTASITIVTHGPGGGASTPQIFTINNPTPTLTSINPTFIVFGSPDTTITLNGSSFINGSTAEFNGVAINTTFLTANQLSAVIPASDLTSTGANSITVVNPGPGGGASSPPLTFMVTATNPAPTLTAVSPNSATVGASDTAITLTGANFVPGSTAEFDKKPLTTAFVNSTELTAVVPSGDLTTVGSDSITVVTVGPGGGTSAPQSFTVNNAPPVATFFVFSQQPVSGPGLQSLADVKVQVLDRYHDPIKTGVVTIAAAPGSPGGIDNASHVSAPVDSDGFADFKNLILYHPGVDAFTAIYGDPISATSANFMASQTEQQSYGQQLASNRRRPHCRRRRQST